MQRRAARQRREYLKTKRVEDLQNELARKTKLIKESHDESKPVPKSLLKLEREIREKLNLEDVDSIKEVTLGIDSEYAMAGVRPPKIIITTSRHAHNPTMLFTKELSLMIPNCHRVNRGAMSELELKKVVSLNEITDVIIVGGSAKQGYPTSLTISHLPHGPTAIFEIKDVVMRHDLPNKPPPMPTHNPHLIFNQMDSLIGTRFKHILKHIFPPVEGSITSKGMERTRVCSFINKRDEIHFRHNLFENTRSGALSEDELNQIAQAKAAGLEKESEALSFIKLFEVGPRFTLKPFKIIRGTFDMKDCETEWNNPTFMNRPGAILADI